MIGGRQMSDVFSISRFRMASDGPGISTLIGIPRCPLDCKYCLNPACHDDDSHWPYYDAKELIDFVKRDELYMRMTGGGIVFGGGEPLSAGDFIKECALYSEKAMPGIPIRIETSLQASQEKLQELLPYVSLWIIDIKDLDPDIYYRYTHGQVDFMWHNLMYLVQHAPYGQDSIRVRVPRIPGYNTKRNVQQSVRRLQPYVKHIEVFSYRLPPEKKEGTGE